MPYTIYDNEEVHYLTRAQAGRLSAVIVGAILVTLVFIAATLTDQIQAAYGTLLLGTAWVGLAAGIAYRLRLLRRVVWCLKINGDHVLGYDYLRKMVQLDWNDLERVELTDQGLTIVGPEHLSLEVRHLFRDYHALSHDVIQAAEMHDRPIYVDGRPWHEWSVYELYPFLETRVAGES